MALFSHIVDDNTGDPVEGLNVVVVDGNGKNLITPVTSDYDGSFSLSDDIFQNSAGSQIKIYGPGYQTKMVDSGMLGYESIYVTASAPVAVQAATGATRDYTFAYVLGGLSVFCFVMAIIIKK